MAVSLSGGCLCGAVRYEYSGELGSSTYCHCHDCRRVTGSAFNVGIRVQANALQILGGQTKAFIKTGDSGRTITREFCPECGSPLFTRSPSKPKFVWIKAGSLDSSEFIEPIDQIWIDSAVSWAYIPADLPGYSRNRPTS